jgi:hypothetical protein
MGYSRVRVSMCGTSRCANSPTSTKTYSVRTCSKRRPNALSAGSQAVGTDPFTERQPQFRCTLVRWKRFLFVSRCPQKNWSLNSCSCVHRSGMRAIAMLCSLTLMRSSYRRNKSPMAECSFRNGEARSWDLQRWNLEKMARVNWTPCLLIPACSVVGLDVP